MAFTPRNAEEYFANQKMTRAAESVAAIGEALSERAEEDRRAYERFYNNLALLSGGTVALSVTYLGHLKTLPKQIVHPIWLEASWFALMACLAFSTFWSFLYTHYGHFARNRAYMEAQKKQLETEVDEIHHLTIENLRTPAERAAFIEPRRKAAQIRDQDAKHHGRREKWYQHGWVWSGRIARLTFLIGIALLLSFAIKNM